MLKYQLKQANDTVKLNSLCGSWMDKIFVGLTGTIIRTYTDESDFNACVEENGRARAEDCCCHFRADIRLNIAPNVIVKELIYDEIDIVQLKGVENANN